MGWDIRLGKLVVYARAGAYVDTGGCVYNVCFLKRCTIGIAGRLADRNNICKVGRDHCFPATRFYPPDAHRLTLISTFWFSPLLHARLAARASVPPTVFSTTKVLDNTQRARGFAGRDVSRVQPTQPTTPGGLARGKRKGSEFFNYSNQRWFSFLPSFRETRILWITEFFWGGGRFNMRFAEFLGEEVWVWKINDIYILSYTLSTYVRWKVEGLKARIKNYLLLSNLYLNKVEIRSYYNVDTVFFVSCSWV